jgi:hypothetical protein
MMQTLPVATKIKYPAAAAVSFSAATLKTCEPHAVLCILQDECLTNFTLQD